MKCSVSFLNDLAGGDGPGTTTEETGRNRSDHRGGRPPVVRGSHSALEVTDIADRPMPDSDDTSLATAPIRKRSVTLSGHRTSVSVEDAFWEALAELAVRRRTTVSRLVEQIDRERLATNLSSGIRLFVLGEARAGRLEKSAQAGGAMPR